MFDWSALEPMIMREHGLAIFGLRLFDRAPASHKACAEALGLADMPGPHLMSEPGGFGAALWVEPGAFLLLGDSVHPSSARALRETLAEIAMLSDLSSAFATFRLAGESAIAILASGCPAPLDAQSFAAIDAIASHYNEIAIRIIKEKAAPNAAPDYLVLCERGHGANLMALLQGAARAL